MKKILIFIVSLTFISCVEPYKVDWDKFLQNSDTDNGTDDSDYSDTDDTSFSDNDCYIEEINDTDDIINDDDSFEIGTKRTFYCDEKPEKCSSWNSVSSYEQTWTGTKWMPEDSETVFNISGSNQSCRFKCNSGCAFDINTSTCETIDCGDDNLIYRYKNRCWSEKSTIKVDQISSYCDNIHGSRFPSISELRQLITNCDDTEMSGECGVRDGCEQMSCGSDTCYGCVSQTDGRYSIFKDSDSLWSSSNSCSGYNCIYWYIKFDTASVFWTDNYQEKFFIRCINIKTGEKKYHTCNPTPKGAKFNIVSQYQQTWNGNEWEPPSDNNTEYNKTASETSCRYICDTNYTWNSGTSICEADTQSVKCVGIPENGKWNTVDTITQTWNGSYWEPDSAGTYNTVPSVEECRFMCQTGYGWDDINLLCSKNRTFYCSSKPTGSDWNTVSSYQQTWNGSQWVPANSSTNYNSNSSTTECRYKCSSTYHWDGYKCVSNTKTYYCNSKPANSDWNTVSSYQQTWNGNTWNPPDDPTTEYNVTESSTSCRYKCSEGYLWNGTECK